MLRYTLAIAAVLFVQARTEAQGCNGSPYGYAPPYSNGYAPYQAPQYFAPQQFYAPPPQYYPPPQYNGYGQYQFVQPYYTPHHFGGNGYHRPPIVTERRTPRFGFNAGFSIGPGAYCPTCR